MANTSNVNASVSPGGLGLVSVLTILFVVLKLVGVISWSWIWVLSPLWIGAGLGILFFLIFFVILFFFRR